MTHDELLAKLNGQIAGSNAIGCKCPACDNAIALRAVVELHKPEQINPTYLVCTNCYDEESGPSDYPCDTIQAIEKELK
jgi:hypothetical protein